jgi:hypothetical protein
MVGCLILMNNDLEKMWKGAVVVYFKILYWLLTGGTEARHEALSQDSQSLDLKNIENGIK